MFVCVLRNLPAIIIICREQNCSHLIQSHYLFRKHRPFLVRPLLLLLQRLFVAVLRPSLIIDLIIH